MERVTTAIGAYAPDFELPGIDGEVHHFARYLDRFEAVVLVFLSNTCPVVQAQLGELRSLSQSLQAQNIALLGLNSNDPRQDPAERLEAMYDFAQRHQVSFPYLRDISQDVAATLGVRVTPEVFWIDSDWVLRYRGPLTADLADTLGLVKQGAMPLSAITPAIAPETIQGSPILWATPAP